MRYALRNGVFVSLDGTADIIPGALGPQPITSREAVGSPTITLGSADSRPTGSQYVTYESLQTGSLTFKQVLNAVPSGKILTLPAGTFTVGSNFTDNGGFSACAIPSNCAGIVGSGWDLTILQMAAGSSTKAGQVPTNTGDTNEFHILDMNHSNCVLKNLQVKGTSQGHFYNGLRIGNGSVQYQTGNVIQDCKFINTAPGNQNYPPGETFQIDANWCDGLQVINVEIDGRNASGTPTSASPIGWNNCINSYAQDVYAHDAVTSMPTFWRCRNIHTVRMRSELNGSGLGDWSGCGINHEQCDGTILHESTTLRPGYNTTGIHGARTGLHLSFFNDDGTHTAATNITINGIVHDAGPDSNGCIGLSNYHDQPLTIIKNGVTLHARSPGFNGNPNADYFIYN